MVMIFSIVIGVFFILIGLLMFKLNQLKAPEIVKSVTARLPVMGEHEMIEFDTYQGYNRLTNKHEDAQFLGLEPYFPKKKVIKEKLGSITERTDKSNQSGLDRLNRA